MTAKASLSVKYNFASFYYLLLILSFDYFCWSSRFMVNCFTPAYRLLDRNMADERLPERNIRRSSIIVKHLTGQFGVDEPNAHENEEVDNIETMDLHVKYVEGDSMDIGNNRVDAIDLVYEEYFDLEEARKRLESILSVSASEPNEVRQFHSTTGSTQNGGRNGDDLTTYLYYKSLSSSSALQFLNGRALNEINDVSSIQHLLVSKDNRPLTSIELIRLQTEIEYLKMLKYGDDAISSLDDFWLQERGTKAAQKLLEANVLTNQGGSYAWTGAEKMLVDLINQFGFFWVEPIHRLATLYYIQGHLTAAKVLFQIVLHVKPWHVDAISTLGKTYSDLEDHESATILASRRLPNFQEAFDNNSLESSRNSHRRQWVENSVEEATKQLNHRHNVTRRLFGSSDDYATDLEKPWNRLHVDFNEQWQ